MDTTSDRVKRGTLTFWMIVLGLFAAWAGVSDILRNWTVLVSGARVCDTIILASGILLLAAGGWRLLARGMQRAAARLGAIAAGVFAVTLFVGVWSGAIPCSGPS